MNILAIKILAGLYLNWPTHKCTLYRLTGHLKDSNNPFFAENGLILENQVQNWQNDGKTYIESLWEEINDEPRPSDVEICQPTDDKLIDIDPELVASAHCVRPACGIHGKIS